MCRIKCWVPLPKTHGKERSPNILMCSYHEPATQLQHQNGCVPKISKPRMEWCRKKTYFKAINNWALLPQEIKGLMPKSFFKDKVKQLLLNHLS